MKKKKAHNWELAPDSILAQLGWDNEDWFLFMAHYCRFKMSNNLPLTVYESIYYTAWRQFEEDWEREHDR